MTQRPTHLRLLSTPPSEEGTASQEPQKGQPGDFAREFGLGLANRGFDKLAKLQREIQAAWGEVEFGSPNSDTETKKVCAPFKVIQGGRD